MLSLLDDVKIGDHIICFDEYSHDYIEHELIVTNIEKHPEEGRVIYGEDITFPKTETDDYITRVNKANFVRVIN